MLEGDFRHIFGEDGSPGVPAYESRPAAIELGVAQLVAVCPAPKQAACPGADVSNYCRKYQHKLVQKRVSLVTCFELFYYPRSLKHQLTEQKLKEKKGACGEPVKLEICPSAWTRKQRNGNAKQANPSPSGALSPSREHSVDPSLECALAEGAPPIPSHLSRLLHDHSQPPSSLDLKLLAHVVCGGLGGHIAKTTGAPQSGTDGSTFCRVKKLFLYLSTIYTDWQQLPRPSEKGLSPQQQPSDSSRDYM